MPFSTQQAKPFTRERILAITPGQMGCYGIYNRAAWIYVGKGDIRDRLLAHFNGDNPCISRNGPTHFMDVVTANMDALERALILEYSPVCNRRVG